MSTDVNLYVGWQVWWKASRASDPKHIKRELEELGLKSPDVDGCTPKEALRTALSNATKAIKTRTVTRLLDRPNSFTVVEEVLGVSQNDYPRLFNVSVDENYLVAIDGLDIHSPLKHWLLAYLQRDVQFYKENLPAKAVSSILVSVVHQLGGTRLSDSGGFYFIPNDKVDVWENVECVLRGADMDGTTHTRFFHLDFQANESAADAIQAQLEEEIKAETERIMKELEKGSFGERKTMNRIEVTERLVEKVENYEQILSRGLSTCKDSIASMLQVLTNEKSVEDNEVFADMFSVK